MRTIHDHLMKRLIAQASEAETQGLIKVADALVHQISNYSDSIRKESEFYSYSEEAFLNDIHNSMWNSIIRIADYYNINQIDAADIQKIVEKVSEDIINEVCIKTGANTIGSYEDPVPGQEEVILEVEDI